MPRVVRIIIYEGENDDLEKQIARSLPNGEGVAPGASGRATINGVKITIQTIIDERKSQQWPKEDDAELNAMVDKAKEELDI